MNTVSCKPMKDQSAALIDLLGQQDFSKFNCLQAPFRCGWQSYPLSLLQLLMDSMKLVRKGF